MCGTTIINNFGNQGCGRPGWGPGGPGHGPCGPGGHGPGCGGVSVFNCEGPDKTSQRMNGVANIISSVGNLFSGLGIFSMANK